MILSEFADFEPEDAWSPGDPVSELLANLIARLLLLGEIVRRMEDACNEDVLNEIAERLAHWRRSSQRTASERAQVRAYDIERHIAVVRERIEHG